MALSWRTAILSRCLLRELTDYPGCFKQKIVRTDGYTGSLFWLNNEYFLFSNVKWPLWLSSHYGLICSGCLDFCLSARQVACRPDSTEIRAEGIIRGGNENVTLSGKTECCWPQLQVSWGFSVPLRKMVVLLWQCRSGLRSLWPFMGLFPFPKIHLASWAGSCFALRADKVALSITAQGRICHFCHGFLQNCCVYPCWHPVWGWLKANCPALELCSLPLKST